MAAIICHLLLRGLFFSRVVGITLAATGRCCVSSRFLESGAGLNDLRRVRREAKGDAVVTYRVVRKDILRSVEP